MQRCAWIVCLCLGTERKRYRDPTCGLLNNTAVGGGQRAEWGGDFEKNLNCLGTARRYTTCQEI